MLSNLSTRVIGMIVAAIIAVLVVWAAFHFWVKSRSQAAQGRVNASQAQAANDSARDAINAVAAAGGREAASEGLTRDNEQKIRAAEGANAAVNPAVRDAGIAALCRRQAYQDNPKCSHK